MNRSRVALLTALVVWLVFILALALALGLGLVSLTRAVAVTHPTVRVTTANTLKDVPVRRARADLARVSRGTDVILAQETATTKARGVPGFRTHAWTGLGRNRPILYRASRFTYVGSGARLAQWWPFRRAFTYVVLRDRVTGTRATFVNFHGVPHVERAGRPRPLPRVRPYRRAMTRLGAFLVTVPGRVWVGGDWNVNRWADRRVRWWGFPYAWQHRRNLACTAPARPTLGRRTVDYVFHRKGQGVRPVRVVVGHGYASDHRPVTVAYRLGG